MPEIVFSPPPLKEIESNVSKEAADETEDNFGFHFLVKKSALASLAFKPYVFNSNDSFLEVLFAIYGERIPDRLDVRWAELHEDQVVTLEMNIDEYMTVVGRYQRILRLAKERVLDVASYNDSLNTVYTQLKSLVETSPFMSNGRSKDTANASVPELESTSSES